MLFKISGTTLILVHNRQILDQWQERLKSFLPDIEVGVIGGGKLKLTGVIDIATYQSHFLVAFFSLKLLLISPRSKLHITLSLCSDHWFFWSILINGPISINERPHSALFN